MALVNNGGFASVQVSGLAEVGAGEDVSAGWVKLSADSKGGVQRDDAAGMEYLVVSAGGGRAVVRL